jgi:hypothetical protein
LNQIAQTRNSLKEQETNALNDSVNVGASGNDNSTKLEMDVVVAGNNLMEPSIPTSSSKKKINCLWSTIAVRKNLLLFKWPLNVL